MKLPPLSVLCLHGYSQNAAVLRSQVDRLAKRLEPRVHLHFQDAPFTVAPVMDSSKPAYSWWLASRDDNGGWTYEGVDVALEAICEANEIEKRRTGSGFAGVFGFSQGGALASLLVGMRVANELGTPPPLPDLRFAIFAGAFRYRATEPCRDDLFTCTKKIPWKLPSLHCIGARDAIIKSSLSEDLAACFSSDARVMCYHSGGHTVPTSTSSLDLIDNFVFQQQRAVLASLASEFSNGSYC